MKSPWTRCFALVVALALTAAACGSDGDGGDSASAAGGEQSTGPVSGDLDLLRLRGRVRAGPAGSVRGGQPGSQRAHGCLLER